jgi:hypothetical protein
MTDLIIQFIDFVSELAVFIRPEGLIAEDVLNNISTLASAGINILKQVNFLIPVPDIFSILLLMIADKIVFLVLFIINWVIRRVFDVIP